MNKLQAFLATPAPSLELQVKFLREGRRSSKESQFGVAPLVERNTLTPHAGGTIQRLPESIWSLAYKVVAFTQSHVQQEKWNTGILDWMFSQEPWWTVEATNQHSYATLFSKAEWFMAMETIGRSHHTMQEYIGTQKPAPEKHAVLWFLHDSRAFAEAMFRRK
jgi:hypothetical protein